MIVEDSQDTFEQALHTDIGEDTQDTQDIYTLLEHLPAVVSGNTDMLGVWSTIQKNSKFEKLPVNTPCPEYQGAGSNAVYSNAKYCKCGDYVLYEELEGEQYVCQTCSAPPRPKRLRQKDRVNYCEASQIEETQEWETCAQRQKVSDCRRCDNMGRICEDCKFADLE